MMADTEGDGPEGEWASRMGHGDEDSSEAATWPRDVGLDAASESGAVPTFVPAGHQAGFRKPAKAAQLLVKRA